MSNQPTFCKSSAVYHSYLVRLWQDDAQSPWRVVTQSVQTGETFHFADLTSLFIFLQRLTFGNPTPYSDKSEALEAENHFR